MTGTSSRMRFPAVIIMIVLLTGISSSTAWANEQPATSKAAEEPPVAAALHGTHAELKGNDDGYDFFSIDQLFMNNPQYAKLLSDLQSHTIGSNWRRKRDVGDEEPLAESPVETPEETSPTAPIAEVTEVTKDMMEAKETSETVEAVEGRTTPLKASSTIQSTTSSSFGFSGSTERASEEPATSAAPIRSSTPRRLIHNKNKNKNKNGNNKNSQNKQQQQQDSTSTLTATNVNKFTVTNSPSATSPQLSSSPLSSSSSSAAISTLTTNAASSSSNMAAAAAAVANATSASNNKDKVGLAPTKYHYYPHNQHIYFLPECAIQQVCNAVYVRLNYTQPLCACPPRYRDPCSASLNEDDNHTIKLVGNAQRKAVTLAKTCENTNELRECRAPKDWSILALQNSRTGKSHYLVICKCPTHFRLEGPLAHDQPTYAGLPGINVYGMLCVPPETYAPKPLKTPSSQSIYNKWKVRPSPVSSYRSFQNATMTTADAE
ncbi:serine-rich adhesin for platelets [Ochlerotatus camptorhynchus]|uniref:serine-rich adhesin for platelets n=1 Tax=Ochlerotatus camptorhynchus TaxID=644619 RepID=UPI0031D5BE9B